MINYVSLSCLQFVMKLAQYVLCVAKHKELRTCNGERNIFFRVVSWSALHAMEVDAYKITFCQSFWISYQILFEIYSPFISIFVMVVVVFYFWGGYFMQNLRM